MASFLQPLPDDETHDSFITQMPSRDRTLFKTLVDTFPSLGHRSEGADEAVVNQFLWSMHRSVGEGTYLDKEVTIDHVLKEVENKEKERTHSLLSEANHSQRQDQPPKPDASDSEIKQEETK